MSITVTHCIEELRLTAPKEICKEASLVNLTLRIDS